MNNSSHWSDGLLPVVYGINTRLSTVTKTTPYQVMFGQEPRSNSDFWKLAQEKEIFDEENLPTPVAYSNDHIVHNKQDDFNNHADTIEDEIIELLFFSSSYIQMLQYVDLFLSCFKNALLLKVSLFISM